MLGKELVSLVFSVEHPVTVFALSPTQLHPSVLLLAVLLALETLTANWPPEPPSKHVWPTVLVPVDLTVKWTEAASSVIMITNAVVWMSETILFAILPLVFAKIPLLALRTPTALPDSTAWRTELAVLALLVERTARLTMVEQTTSNLGVTPESAKTATWTPSALVPAVLTVKPMDDAWTAVTLLLAPPAVASMVVKHPDKPSVTLTLKFARLLATPTLSVPIRVFQEMPSPRVPTAKPMVLATLVLLTMTVVLRTEDHPVDNPRATPLTVVSASLLSLVPTILIAMPLATLVEVKIVRLAYNACLASSLIPLPLVEPSMVVWTRDKSIAIKLLASA
jgi:hypothetical protein